jgi:hypothetical protein
MSLSATREAAEGFPFPFTPRIPYLNTPATVGKRIRFSPGEPADVSVQALYYQFSVASTGVASIAFGLWRLLTEGYSAPAALITVLGLALVGSVFLWIKKLGVSRHR